MAATCINCSGELGEADEHCLTCGVAPTELPNVRVVNTAKEKSALEERYLLALKTAEANGCLANVKQFESALKASFAVISTDIHILRQLVVGTKGLYQNYASLVQADVRKSAPPEDDRRRRTAESILFDGYAGKIVYAAVSLDGMGLKSYGNCAIVLRDVAVEKRATVLEENSFVFVEKRCTVRGEVPAGYKAVWQERDKLGVAKLASRIGKTTPASEFPALVLHNGTDREDDDYLEVQIYGVFDGNAIQSVKATIPKRGELRAVARVVKAYLEKAGKSWTEDA